MTVLLFVFALSPAYPLDMRGKTGVHGGRATVQSARGAAEARIDGRREGVDGIKRPEQPRRAFDKEEQHMAALIALVLILAIFGGLGFAAHVLWYVLIIAVLLWLIGFFVGGVADGGGRRWYGR
jgi:hypothetical protein